MCDRIYALEKFSACPLRTKDNGRPPIPRERGHAHGPHFFSQLGKIDMKPAFLEKTPQVFLQRLLSNPEIVDVGPHCSESQTDCSAFQDLELPFHELERDFQLANRDFQARRSAAAAAPTNSSLRASMAGRSVSVFFGLSEQYVQDGTGACYIGVLRGIAQLQFFLELVRRGRARRRGTILVVGFLEQLTAPQAPRRSRPLGPSAATRLEDGGPPADPRSARQPPPLREQDDSSSRRGSGCPARLSSRCHIRRTTRQHSP